jgi:hypothetical protein
MIEVTNLTNLRVFRAVKAVSSRCHGTGVWLPRSQRRRQDDHHAHRDRLHAGHPGSVSVDGFDVFGSPSVRKRIGYLPEHPPVLEMKVTRISTTSLA